MRNGEITKNLEMKEMVFFVLNYQLKTNKHKIKR